VAIIVLMKGNKTAVKMNYGNGILIWVWRILTWKCFLRKKGKQKLVPSTSTTSVSQKFLIKLISTKDEQVRNWPTREDIQGW
jgi:hypothetical protein